MSLCHECEPLNLASTLMRPYESEINLDIIINDIQWFSW
jgi:hypothetical protein